MTPSVLKKFCFGKRDIPRLSDELQQPYKIVCCQGTLKHCVCH